jgi:hypothetical protein
VGGAIFAGSVAESALAWFDAVASGNDEALREARLGSLEAEFRRLSERVARLERETATDRNDPLTREQTFSRFAKDVADAKTPAKREALINAAAHQFDPRMGSAEARSFWYSVVAGLTDLDLLMSRLLAEHEHVTITVEPVARVTLGRAPAGGLRPSLTKAKLRRFSMACPKPRSRSKVSRRKGRPGSGSASWHVASPSVLARPRAPRCVAARRRASQRAELAVRRASAATQCRRDTLVAMKRGPSERGAATPDERAVVGLDRDTSTI